MNKYHFFLVYICVSCDRLLKFLWHHLVLISLATLKKTHKQLFSATKYTKRWMNEKTIQCLPNTSQHLPIYVQQFLSYSNRKCKKSPFSRTVARIFVSPGDATATITQYIPWMERLFNACQTPHSMYPSIFNSFQVIRCLKGNSTLKNIWLKMKIYD